MMETRDTFVLRRIKDLLWFIAICGLVAAVGRFATGLGASTNMTDVLPWGMWKIFNMVAGAALATSGFVVACVIYIFQLEKYRPMARLAILIGFLGYGSSLTALLFDIGLPHRFWHPLVMWNPHSFLFEVFWCVSMYWMVTAFELTPVILERFPFPRLTHFLHKIALPVVVLGITLSTMHHSSLGSLFMVSPTRLHPLWHTTWLPVEFFTSAMGAGLAVIILISIIYSVLYRKSYNLPVLSGLAKASAGLLLLYFAIRITDLTLHRKWMWVFGKEFDWEGALFLVEFALQVIIPVIIFLVPRTRESVAGLTVGTLSAFLGLVLHRLNTGIIGYFRSAGEVYYPNLAEIALGLGVIAAAALVFLFLVEHFYIMEPPEECARAAEEGAHVELAPQWTWEEIKAILFSPAVLRISAIIIAAIPISYLAFSSLDIAVKPFSPLPQPVAAATAGDEKREHLVIDANRNGMAVTFDHKIHKESFECLMCHNISLPRDHANPCWLCHKDMTIPTSIFDHEAHHGYFGGKKSCSQCHRLDQPKGGENAKACIECHGKSGEWPMDGMERYTRDGKFNYMAPGYKDAMHGVCLTCHRRLGLETDCMAERPGDIVPCFGNCAFCHPLNPGLNTAQNP